MNDWNTYQFGAYSWDKLADAIAEVVLQTWLPREGRAGKTVVIDRRYLIQKFTLSRGDPVVRKTLTAMGIKSRAELFAENMFARGVVWYRTGEEIRFAVIGTDKSDAEQRYRGVRFEEMLLGVVRGNWDGQE